MSSSSTFPSTVVKQWKTDLQSRVYEISTDKSLLDRSFINDAFSSDEMFWIHAMPPEDIETLIANCLMVGLYDVTADRTVIGMARVVTDQLTFSYVTDVYVRPESRGLGLARWLVRCTKEVSTAFPHMHRALLLVDLKARGSVALYEKEFGMEVGLGSPYVGAMTWLRSKHA